MKKRNKTTKPESGVFLRRRAALPTDFAGQGSPESARAALKDDLCGRHLNLETSCSIAKASVLTLTQLVIAQSLRLNDGCPDKQPDSRLPVKLAAVNSYLAGRLLAPSSGEDPSSINAAELGFRLFCRARELGRIDEA